MRTHSFILFAICLGPLLVAGPLRATIANYQDWWWNDQQSGHGLNIGQQNDVLFVSWFTYDEAGAGMWLTMAAQLNGSVATGNWVRTTGPQLGTTFEPANVVRTTVGTGTLTFANLHSASLDWTVNGKTGVVPLARMSWGSTLPASGEHQGRTRLEVKACAGGVTFNLPMTSTYTLDGNAITIVDDYEATGTRLCTMTGMLVPSGSYLKVHGSYSCIRNVATGTWSGTLLVRPPFIARDEVLRINGSDCVYHQTTVTAPSALEGP